MNDCVNGWIFSFNPRPNVQDTKSVLGIADHITWKDTCIHHYLAFMAVHFHLTKHSFYDDENNNVILIAIEYILTHNFFFMFDDKYYLQVIGALNGGEIFDCQPVFCLVGRNICFFFLTLTHLLIVWSGIGAT